MGLTEKGVDHYQDIIRLVFAFINKLKSSGPPPEYIFNEKKTMAKINYDYKTRSKAILHSRTMASMLRDWQGCAPNYAEYEAPIEDIFTKSHQYNTFSPDLISDILNKFKPEECFIIFTSLKNKETEPADKIEIEPIYTTEFLRIKLDEKWM